MEKMRSKKKNVIKTCVILIAVIISLSSPMAIYADDSNKRMLSNVTDTYVRYIISEDNISKVSKGARGRLLSLAELQLSDEGNGVLGVYAETLCHTAVKEIYMSIYLDVWDEGLQDWVTLDSYDYNWNASDNPVGYLTDVSVSFLLEGLQRGRMYSLRGLHLAVGFTQDSEMMSTGTSGITLD